jgi:hypothetical protein
MHCHIAAHISEGLGVQFLEAASEIVLPNAATYEQQCQSWVNYDSSNKRKYHKDDSGL